MRSLAGSVLAYLAAALVVYGSFSVGRLVGLAVLAGMVLAFFLARVALPRAAHRAFIVGKYQRAGRLYRFLGWIRLAANARHGSQISRAACATARGQYEQARQLLAALEPDRLIDSNQAAWHNNQAYSLLRDGRELRAALEHAETAVSLRPRVPGFRHTRGAALLAVGRVEEAIRELDEVWRRSDDASALLEAERCFDLGTAWLRSGEREYATDYFERCYRAAPGSTWAERARCELQDRDHTADLAELVG